MRAADMLLMPAMFLLGGCRRDSIQLTHYWHSQPIDATLVDQSACVLIEGDDTSLVNNNRLWPFPAFHAPVFGGWTKYALLESAIAPWHVGWIHVAVPAGSRARSHVQRLSIEAHHVRVLHQSPGFTTAFFAVDNAGNQVRLTHADDGTLGDGKYPHIMLL